MSDDRKTDMINDPEIQKRPRYEGYTIDDKGTKIRDDGFSVEKKERGWVLRVNFVDVAYHVPKDSDMDREGEIKGFDHYIDNKKIGFLPPNKVRNMGFREDSPRPSLTLTMHLDNEGVIRTTKLERALFQAIKTLTPQQAIQELSDGNEDLKYAQDLFRVLFAKRNPHKTPDELQKRLNQESDGQNTGPNIIQEFMEVANSSIAGYLNRKGYPAIHRIGTKKDATDHVLDPSKRGLRIICSSPLRRMSDLINQRIVIAAMSGAPHPYGPDLLKDLACHFNALRDDYKWENSQKNWPKRSQKQRSGPKNRAP